MKTIKILLAGLIVMSPLAASANLIVNGSFENTTSTGCDSNLAHVAFDSKMANVTAWGNAEEIDIYSDTCFGSNAPIDGDVKLHINDRFNNGSSIDAFNFDLIASLVEGETYKLSFYMASVSAFSNSLGGILIGTSIDANSFGAQIFSASSSALDTWNLFSHSFVAGANANYLSVAANRGWSAIDGFTLEAVSTTTVPEPATLALLGVGLAGIGLSRRRRKA